MATSRLPPVGDEQPRPRSVPDNGDSPELNPLLPDHLRAEVRRLHENRQASNQPERWQALNELHREGRELSRAVADQITTMEQATRTGINKILRSAGIVE